MNISDEEYQQLIHDSMKLQALENGGVDNWEWYDDSIDQWNEDNPRNEL